MIAARPAVAGRPTAHVEFRIVVTYSLRRCGFNSRPSRDLQLGRSGRPSNAPQQSADAVEAM